MTPGIQARSLNRLTVTSPSRDARPFLDILTRVVSAALDRHGVTESEISLVLVDDPAIAALNERYLGHLGPTDVLTFDLRDDRNSASLEAEVIVSLQTAEREASARYHALETELALYAVHGTLHLLGYDDHDPVSAAKMHTVEDDILESAGLSRVFRNEPRAGVSEGSE